MGTGVVSVLRSAIAAAVGRCAAGARVALALLRMFALELHGTLARVFVYCAAVGVFALIIAELVGSRDGAVKVAHPEWAEIIRPLPAFVMRIPDFDTPRYSIWRQANGSGRKDIFNFGEP